MVGWWFQEELDRNRWMRCENLWMVVVWMGGG